MHSKNSIIDKKTCLAKPRIEVGTPIDMAFTVMNFNGGEAVLIKIYEYDNNGLKDLVDTIKAKLKVGTGQCKTTWSRSLQQANQDLAADQKAGDTGPLEYRFEVEVDGSLGNKTSGALNLTKTIKIRSNTDQNVVIPEGTKVILIDADGVKLNGAITDGSVTFEKVLIGPIEIDTHPDKA